MNNFKFTCSVSMEVTEAQYKELSIKLENLGYEYYTPFFTIRDCIYISTHMLGLDNCYYKSPKMKHKYYVDTYNPELFLALAAMTDREDGIKGEYWKYSSKWVTSDFTTGRLYKQKSDNITDSCVFIDNKGVLNGCSVHNKDFFCQSN